MTNFKGFNPRCPKCTGLGQVVLNQDHIKWFNCYACGYKGPWKIVSREKHIPLPETPVEEDGELIYLT